MMRRLCKVTQFVCVCVYIYSVECGHFLCGSVKCKLRDEMRHNRGNVFVICRCLCPYIYLV